MDIRVLMQIRLFSRNGGQALETEDRGSRVHLAPDSWHWEICVERIDAGCAHCQRHGVGHGAAAEILVKQGFTVLPYINADPVLAKRLQDIGTATVMPLGSPIGSNRGIEARLQIEIIIEQATVPVVVDAGLGAPSHAAEAMEMGADAVLVNTAIAIASDPVRMAKAFKKAIEAGREAREIGLAEKLGVAAATSPLTGFLTR